MTNEQFMTWFDAQSHDMKRDINRALDALENAGINGKAAAETVMVAATRANVPPARLAAVFAENVVKH